MAIRTCSAPVRPWRFICERVSVSELEKPNIMGGCIYHPLERLAKLHDGYRQTFSIDGNFLLLIQHEGQLSLLESICPHAGYPLEAGKIIDRQLRCPMHGYMFDIASGECMFSPEGPCRGLQRYELVYRGAEVGVVL